MSKLILGAEAIDYVHRKGWITDWEKKFSLDTMRKWNLTEKQLAKREQTNKMLAKRMRRNR